MKKLNIEHLENAIISFQSVAPELKGMKFIKSDARLGKRVALSKDGINPKTDFLTIPEMNQFLRGYYFKTENRI